LKKLTIAIPTYNGARTIKRTLDSIFNQEFSAEDVDIIVCDNCSTDNTLEILSPYQSNITIFKNESNLGGDRNFQQCVERSVSTYVWIVGDDDFLKKNSINGVLAKMANHTYACIFVNYSLYDIKLQKEIVEKYLPIHQDIVAKGISEFLEHTNIAGNFLSSIIHNKKYFESVDSVKYYGTCFLQFAVILDYVNNNDTLIIADALVSNMGDSTDREFNLGGVSVKIISNLYTIVKTAPSAFIEPVVRQKLLTSIHKTLKYKIISAKRLGLKVDHKLLKELINNFGGYGSFWWLEMILLFIPNIFIIGLFKIFKSNFFNSVMNRLKLKK
jgi:glycosyltransferase involved in cell wall biosynthesis